MTSSGANYNPTFETCTGFGQNTSNAAPSLFVESIAIDLDCSVYGSLFVTNNIQVGKNVEIKGSLAVSGGPVRINANTVVKGYLKTDNLDVKEIEFRAVQLPGLDNYYVLASYISS